MQAGGGQTVKAKNTAPPLPVNPVHRTVPTYTPKVFRMLEILVKRDGREEPAMPSKVNSWGEWASGELQGRVDWTHVVRQAWSTMPQKATTLELQMRLIKVCRELRTWAGNLMAGKLYSTVINKKVHPDGHPSLKALHEKLFGLGLMRQMNYSDDEYLQAEAMLVHQRDFEATYFELHQVREKYSIVNRVTGDEYETMQFVYMRMAMALAEDQPAERRMDDMFHFYDLFSRKIINAPTPNYLNLGTPLRGFASCCLYAVDDNCASLAAGDHIAYTMTYMSAGIGSNINIRSLGEPIRGGAIEHQGKRPYYKSLAGAMTANLQNGRGGACTTYYSAYDPDAPTVIMMKNPRTTEDKKIRDIDFCIMTNKHMARLVARKQQMFTFNVFSAPDLMEAFFGDGEEFERLYAKYEADVNFKKNYVSARELILQAWNQMYETGRGYMAWMDEANRHTPYYEKIRSSNLCTEIFEPTSPYQNVTDLYQDKDPGYIILDVGGVNPLTIPWSSPVTKKNHTTWAGNLQIGDTFGFEGQTYSVKQVLQRVESPEVALCSLAGLVVSNIKSDEEAARASYYALLMVSKCIHQAEYALPHIGYTAKQRMNAGVGITGLATHLARLNLKYTDIAGKKEMHRIAERHMYNLIKSSIRLSKEQFGLAPWMHKTKWPEGWTPMQTYTKNVDRIADFEYFYDWVELSQEIVDNGGLAHSVLAAFMPTESSSKASGAPNSLYPARFLSMLKSDEHVIIDWCAPDNDIIGDQYQLAFDVPTRDMIDCYAIFQKFTDQGISADTYRRIGQAEKIPSSEMLGDYIYMTEMGIKSRYYTNSLTSKASNKKTNAGIAEGTVSSLSFQGEVPQVPAAEAMSLLDRIAAQARAQQDAQVGVEDEDGTFIGNDGPVCTSGGCSL